MELNKHRSELSTMLMGVLLVVVAIVTLGVTSLVQYVHTRNILMEEAERRAQDNIDHVEAEFTLVVDLVESALHNHRWSAAVLVSYPDSLWAFTRGIVDDNPFIYGSSMAMVPGYHREEQFKVFAPYAHREEDSVVSVQLGTEEYDYASQEWFAEGVKAGEKGHWSEPYFDEGGGNKLMTTYSVPVHDHRGQVAAVLTADVALDWVSDRLGRLEDYPFALKMLVSETGQIMASSPQYESLRRKNIMEVADEMENAEEFKEVNRGMLAGEEGCAPVHLQGKLYYVYYDKVQKTGWSMSITIPVEEIYGDLRKLNLQVGALQTLGVLMLILILVVTIRNLRKMADINAKKNRMDSELHVANTIQMAMLPKDFPPFPERNDIDIFARVVPAREVGGDLYDFFIRDERLYFCIGDVSGKGVPASLIMSVTRSLFRTVAGHEKSPVRIVSSMNQNLVEMNVNDMFVTFFCGVLDMQTGHLRYCNAGHNAPVLLDKDQSAPLSVIPNLPLGILPSMNFEEQEIDMTSGAGLFLYTDGLTEAENQALELFGEERMMKVLQPDQTATVMVERMTEAVQSFVGEAPQSDDLTMLHFRYLNDTPMEKTERHLILHNDIQQIPQLAEFVETVGSLAHLGSAMAMSLNLALEEAVTNVIMYAYPPGADGLVDIEAIIRKDELQFIISDSGTPFDPTAAPDADVTLDLEDRPIGGLGIFLVRNIMDKVHYQRTDGKNILTMSKNLL